MFHCSLLCFKKKLSLTLTEGSNVCILPSNPDVLSSTGSITGDAFHWTLLFALLCFTFSLSSWFGFSSVFLHLYWILISYYELASLFHTVGFVLQEKFILLNFASVILCKLFSGWCYDGTGNFGRSHVALGCHVISVFAGVCPSGVILFIKIVVVVVVGTGAILLRLSLFIQVEGYAEFRSDWTIV